MLLDAKEHQFKNPSGFIVIDGVNGAGKTTLQTKLAEFLSGKGIRSFLTREPGSTELGKKLREILLSSTQEKLSTTSELLLFAADRAEHVEKVIKPKLAEQMAVLCDRYSYSTIAFQGYGRGLDLNLINSINQIATGGLTPDLLLLLDLDPALGLQRGKARDKAAAACKDKFENEDLEFHTRIRNGFLQIAATIEEPCFVIDAAKGAESVFAQAKESIAAWLTAFKGNK